MNRDILGICNAYEQGYGHGYGRRGLPNPYKTGTDEWQAWDYGYSEGARKKNEHAIKQEEL